jgi:hypothetical protein
MSVSSIYIWEAQREHKREKQLQDGIPEVIKLLHISAHRQRMDRLHWHSYEVSCLVP